MVPELKYFLLLPYLFSKVELLELFIKQDCIPAGCIPPACWPYLPACTVQGGRPLWGVPGLGGCLLPAGCLVPDGMSAPGGRGVSAPGWGGCLVPGGRGLSQHALRQTPREQNSWHTLLKILPCPKLRLQTVTRQHSSRMCTANRTCFGGYPNQWHLVVVTETEAHTVSKWAVRILLECFLVEHINLVFSVSHWTPQ